VTNPQQPPPLNAPPGVAPVIGVQPGTSPSIILARYVVIFGADGGLFIYDGTPAKGNPPVLSAVAPGTTEDPYGNSVASVLNIGDFSGAHIGWDADGNTYVSDASDNIRIAILVGAGPMIGFWEAGEFDTGFPQLSIASGMGTVGGNTIPAGITLGGLPILAYSSTPPAEGNLEMSVTQNNGTDTFGNATLGGVAFYAVDSGASEYGAVVLTNASAGSAVPQLSFQVASAASGPWSQKAVLSIDQLGNLTITADGNLNLQSSTESIVCESALTAEDGVTLDSTLTVDGDSTLVGNVLAENAVTIENIATPGTPTGGVTLYGASGQPAYVNPQALVMNISGAQFADFTSTTVTGTTLTTVTKSWSIPANDAEAGAVYKITMFGQGTQGSTADGLEVALLFAGTAQVGAQLGSTFQAASDAFGLIAEYKIVCKTTGSSATWWLPGQVQAANGIGVNLGSSPITQSSTSAISVAIQFKWTASTGSPTFTSEGSYFERVA
jgi:hypothetical protein